MRWRTSDFWRREPPGPDESASVTEFAVLSALLLFWEICLIRWISTEVRVFAYYKNLSLMAAFLGFGVGLLTVERLGDWRKACLARLAILIGVICIYPVSFLRLTTAPAFFQEFTWREPISGVAVTLKFYGVLLLVFCLNVAAFIPWGRRIGFYFDRLRPVPAYSVNVAANLAGIGLYSILSAVGAPPLVWVVVGILPLLPWPIASVLRSRRLLLWAGLALAVVTAQQLWQRFETHWSPYYKITVVPPLATDEAKPFYQLEVNHDYHQRILDLSSDFIRSQPEVFASWQASYDLPYIVGRAGRVLVLGAGTGNDVAAALRAGAASVTAVEIDPTILAIGRRLHPEKPYASPKVQVRVADARTFLRNPPPGSRFDMVVFGLIDSHTQVSGMSSLRLDNFVYTRESFVEARRLLDPDHGLMALSFSGAWGESPWTLRRIHRMLTDAFGVPPRMAYTGYDRGVTFLAGPAAASSHPLFESEGWRQVSEDAAGWVDPVQAERETPATDDWPFLYLERRTVPLEYWILIVLVAAVSLVWVATVGRVPSRDTFSLHFFLLGGAFLLVEVRNLVAFSLFFGSTWKVNGVAIGGVLVMILAANLVASRVGNLNRNWLYAALLTLLAVGVWLGPSDVARPGRWAEVLLVPLYLSAPIFCAGLIFIRSFTLARNPAGALGANLLGGICGALLENASLSTGIASLQVLAFVLYGASLLALLRESSVGRRLTAQSLSK